MSTSHRDKVRKNTMYNKFKKLYMGKKYNTFEREATKYLKIYPNDIKMRFMRAKTYRKLNCFEEAIKDLKYILDLEVNEHALTELFYILYYLNMYEDALKLLPLIYKRECIKESSLAIAEVIMKKSLGMDTSNINRENCDYIMSQTLEYRLDEAFDHIKEFSNEKDKNHSYYSKNINLDYLFYIVKNNLNSENKVNTIELLEIHYIGISNVGYYNNTPCNFIKVITIPNTTNILTIYPTNDVDIDFVYNIEFDHDKLFNREEKTKKLSQIDKFNSKYKRV